jgi:ribose transport system permease protein
MTQAQMQLPARERPRPGLLQRLHLPTWVGPLGGLICIYLLFVFIGPESFATMGTAQTIARQTAIVATASLGMTIIMISGGIDLSVGSAVALVTVITAALLQREFPPATAAAAGVLAGALAGLLNGILVSTLRVGPFIVTLGTLLIFRGAAKGLAGEQKIDAPMTYLADLLRAGKGIFMFSPAVLVMVVLAILVALMLRYMRLGRHFFAIGSNEQTARLCGIAVGPTKTLAYCIGGVLTGVAGVMQFSRLTVGDPTVAIGMELDVIAAVVIGGGSLSGGEGSIMGSVIGALIMTTIRAGSTQIGWSNWVQEIVTGLIIVTAVTLDRLRHRRA